MYKICDLYNLNHTISSEYLQRFTYPWEALIELHKFIAELGMSLDDKEYIETSPQVWIHKTAKIAPTAYLNAPCIICEDAEVRHCAYIRGVAIVGKGAVVGNSTELKNVILFDGVQVPHYNYVGDSILGYKSHLGAGAVTSNVKSDKSLVVIRDVGTVYKTNLKKCGAMIGDFAEVGCNTVLNPGTVIGKNTIIYPVLSVRGSIPANSIYKNSKEIINKR